MEVIKWFGIKVRRILEWLTFLEQLKIVQTPYVTEFLVGQPGLEPTNGRFLVLTLHFLLASTK